MPSQRRRKPVRARRTRKTRTTRRRRTAGMDSDFDPDEFDTFDLRDPARKPTPKKRRTSRKASTCATPNCRRPIGHPGEHSALAERLLAMSPQARKQYYQQVNDPRCKERKRANRSTSCNTPHCQKARNHSPPCTQKAKFVRCREKYCRKAANHDGKHSDSTGSTKAIQKMLDSKAGAYAALGRDVAVQVDLAITGNTPSR